MHCMRSGRRALGTGVAATALAVGGLFVFAGMARAHHGRDFLLTQTAELPHAGQIFILSRQDWVDEGDESEIEWEPTFLFGVSGRFTVEVHSHVAREGSGESFEYESTAPALHLRLTPQDAAWGVALSAEYEIASLDDEADRAEAWLVASRRFGSSLVALNLGAEEEQEDEAEVEWGWAIGFRSPLSDKVDWGLEAAGGFEADSQREGLVGFFFEPGERWSLLVGAGTALGDEGPDLSVRTSFVWRIK
jgi:hypothetical protein